VRIGVIRVKKTGVKNEITRNFFNQQQPSFQDIAANGTGSIFFEFATPSICSY